MAPDFLIIGSPKAGSTALHDALSLHPRLSMSRVKEPKFYLTDGHPPPRGHQRGPGDAHSAREWIWRRSDYDALFATAPAGNLTGESTPFYLWDRAAQRRIHHELPDAKLIAVLRDPVDRAYSNWTHLWCDGLEPEPDFVTACRREPQRVADGWAPFWRYLEMGRYGEQLQHLYTLFPREQVYVLRYRQLVDTPVQTLDAICTFLGVGTGLLQGAPSSNVSTWVEPTRRNALLRRAVIGGAALGSHLPPKVWRQACRPVLAAMQQRHGVRPRLAVAARRELVGHFAEDVELLGSLTGIDHSDWLSDTGRGTFRTRRS